MIARVVELTAGDPPGEATHWTAAAMAKATGISVSSVQRIWRSHGLAPHRVRQFKLSNDPKLADKLKDVVGLYVDPPAHAVVLSVDEKSRIQPGSRPGARPQAAVNRFIEGQWRSQARRLDGTSHSLRKSMERPCHPDSSCDKRSCGVNPAARLVIIT